MKNLLIVDDDRVSRAVVIDHLDNGAYRFAQAGDGEEMFERVATETPDLILLDIEMPKLDGISACRKLKMKVDTHDIPVIIMTATNNADQIGRCFQAGASDFLVKPINKSALTWRVRAAIERAALIQELTRAHADAQAATRAQAEFLANVSHEIRSPMTAILGFAEVLADDLTKPSNIQAIDTIKRNGNYLLDLINDILDLSKIESGKLELEKIDVSVHDLVVDVHELMKVRADAKGLPLSIEFKGSLPATLKTDPTRLRQILINLVGNAVKFTEQGSVRLVMECFPNEQPPTIQFQVIDTGIGITAQQQKRLFEAFSQADSSTTRKFGGTGLGLCITKRLVGHLAGQIDVTSQPGKGSTFQVTLPLGSLQGVSMIDGTTLSRLAAQHSSKTMDGTPFIETPVIEMPVIETPIARVLLAEEGADNQRLISLLLEKSVAEIVVVENGQQAIDAAQRACEQNEPFDVILMDMQMPVVDGYVATRTLRQTGYTGPIIAWTAHAMTGARDQCLAAGCDDYLSKPIDRRRLLSMVSRYAAVSADCSPSTARQRKSSGDCDVECGVQP